MTVSMLLLAVRLVQNIQLACFTAVFLCMVLQSRRDRSLRWLLWNYVCGAMGALLTLPALHVPSALAGVLWFEVPQIRYALLHLAVVSFVGRGERTRWIGLWLALLCLPLYAASRVHPRVDGFELLDLAMGVQTAWTASMLWSSREAMTRWPRGLMGGFLVLYSSVELAGLAFRLKSGHIPSTNDPLLESLSIGVYIVAGSLTPVAFIWMHNARLLGNLLRQTVLDPLTGLLNRRGFEDSWMRVADAYRITGRNFTLAVADVDHFKAINDTHGHAQGDAVLQGLAGLLRGMLRETDLVGRLGGEEFVVVLCQVDEAQAAPMIERLRAALADYDFPLGFPLGKGTVRASASFGVTGSRNRPDVSLQTLLQEADGAMYAAKRGGRNRVRVHSPVAVAADASAAVPARA